MSSEAQGSLQLRPSWRSLLADPAALRSLAAIIGGTIALLWPERTLEVLVAIAGIALMIGGGAEAWRAIQLRHPPAFIRGIADIAIGAVLIVLREASGEILTLLITIYLVGRGLLDLVRAYRARRDRANAGWFAVKGFTEILAGGVTLLLVSEAVEFLVFLVGIGWVATGAMALASQLTHPERPHGPPHFVDAPTRALDWLQSRDVGDEVRQEVVDKLVYEGAAFRRRVSRFVALMGFSSAIAALGIQTDSTAVVIGAMLVAPLMTPILAMSTSILMGWPRRTARSLGLVVLGIAIAIAVSFLLARYAPAFITADQNSQILSRTSPTLLDLLIAIAAGGAGAYATTRADVSDSLPGVAIAVALVPPLAVVGITLEAGDGDSASGAMLLFLTNLIGIIAASAVVFVLVGFSPWSELDARRDQLRRSYTTVFGALLVIAIPLSITGQQILRDASVQTDAVDVVTDWADDAGNLTVAQVQVDGSDVDAVVLGESDADPDVDALQRELSDRLGRSVNLTVRVIPEEVFTANGG